MRTRRSFIATLLLHTFPNSASLFVPVERTVCHRLRNRFLLQPSRRDMERNGDPTSFRQVFKAQTGLNSPPIDGFADLHSRGLNHLLRILFLVALFRLRAFLWHLSKHFRHVLDLVPNIKTYIDRG